MKQQNYMIVEALKKDKQDLRVELKEKEKAISDLKI
jgi:hypothetical protein